MKDQPAGARKSIKDVIHSAAAKLAQNLSRFRRKGAGWAGAQAYWETLYARGGSSGAGSYGAYAEYKASVLNAFIKDYQVKSAVEFGCGDGNQVSLIAYPSYIGLDVSRTAVALCKARFARDAAKSFFLYEPGHLSPEWKAGLAISMDVVYHLVEDEVFELYMKDLFSASKRFVVIYSSNAETAKPTASHVRHRRFTRWVKEHAPEWKLFHAVDFRKHPVHPDRGLRTRTQFFFYRRDPAPPVTG